MTFNIDLKELEEEFTTFHYALDDVFFASFPSSSVRKGNMSCELTIRNAGVFYELDFHMTGAVTVPCDRCLDDMELPVDAECKQVVKFGEEDYEDDELIIISEDNPVIDVSWLIHETIELNIPIKHVHADGECNAEMLGYIAGDDSDLDEGNSDGNKEVDPRWSKLSELMDKN